MSKYNKYAVELDKAFREAAGKMMELNKQARAAQARLEKANGHYKEKYFGERDAERKAAEAYHTKVMAEGRESFKAIWDEYEAAVKDLTAELSAELENAFQMNTNELDPAAVALLNSGTLRAADMTAMMSGYVAKGNTTMQKVLANYANKAKDTARGADLSAYLDIVNAVDHAGDAVLKKWGELVDMGIHCSGGAYSRRSFDNAEYNERMAACWVDMCGGIIEGF